MLNVVLYCILLHAFRTNLHKRRAIGGQFNCLASIWFNWLLMAIDRDAALDHRELTKCACGGSTTAALSGLNRCCRAKFDCEIDHWRRPTGHHQLRIGYHFEPPFCIPVHCSGHAIWFEWPAAGSKQSPPIVFLSRLLDRQVAMANNTITTIRYAQGKIIVRPQNTIIHLEHNWKLIVYTLSDR